MKIKKYEASDMKEALQMIKEDLGSNAVILSTRKVMKSNNFGIFAKPMLEVTAAIDYEGRYNKKQGPKQKQSSQNNMTYNYEDYPADYPSAYTKVPTTKKKVNSNQNIKKESVKKENIKRKEISSNTPYGAYSKQKQQNNYNIDDEYLLDTLDNETYNNKAFYAPPIDTDEDILTEDYVEYDNYNYNEDYQEVKPRKEKVEVKKQQNTKKEAKHQKEDNKEQIELAENKSHAEINAERMAEVIKAVGLDKFTNLLDDIGHIKKQLVNMQSTISDNKGVDLPIELREFYSLLIKNGLDDIITYRLLKDIETKIEGKKATSNQIKSIVIEKLAEIIPIEINYHNIINNQIIALAGPTGVGKTTTVAKIAATMALKYNKKVCLITVDNFRIGAVEQLKTYAEIVNLPLYVAASTEELSKILAKVKGTYDCILIDSMGRSQYDTNQIKAIGDFFKIDPKIITTLVLSMASNHIELYDTFEKYKVLEPDYLIFTKLDETKYFGPLINIPVKKKLPLLLCATGQNVPDDMEIPDGKKIASKILQEIPNTWSDK